MRLITTTLFLFFVLPFLLAQTIFIEDTQNNFTDIYEGETAFADVDGDGDQDLFVLGYSSMAFADVDDDNDVDLLLAGQTNTVTPAATYLYLNDGNGNFSNSNQNLTPVLNCAVGFADVDNDEDPDIFISGMNGSLTGAETELYLNDGNGNFTLTNNLFTKFFQGAFDFADIDGDDDLDLVVTGFVDATTEVRTEIYGNDGEGNFTLIPNDNLEDMSAGTVTFGDIDGDDDPDLLMTGFGANSGHATRLYKNDGLGNFDLVINSGLENISFSACSLVDVDLDNDLDILMAGRNGSIGQETTRFYLNDGNGNFTEDFNSSFTGVTAASLDLADIDNDSDPDLFIMGIAPDEVIYSKLYINDFSVNISPIISEQQIKAYPNPFDSWFSIDLGQKMERIQIEISNSVGQILEYFEYSNISMIELNMTSFSEGVYFLKINTSTQQNLILPIVKAEE